MSVPQESNKESLLTYDKIVSNFQLEKFIPFLKADFVKIWAVSPINWMFRSLEACHDIYMYYQSTLQLKKKCCAVLSFAALLNEFGFGLFRAELYRGWFPVVTALCCSNFVYFYTFNSLKLKFIRGTKSSPLTDLSLAFVSGAFKICPAKGVLFLVVLTLRVLVSLFCIPVHVPQRKTDLFLCVELYIFEHQSISFYWFVSGFVSI